MRARHHYPLQEWLRSEEASQLLSSLGISYHFWELAGWELRIPAVLAQGPFRYAFTMDFSPRGIPYLDGSPWGTLPLHYHTDMEARLMLSGRLTMRVQPVPGQLLEVELFPGDFVVLPPGIWHRFDLVDRSPLSCLCLATEADSLAPLFPGSILSRHGN
ncbi:cupin domain-containing protein [bacterium]|nr:cupin domain-containing protein [bacterium]